MKPAKTLVNPAIITPFLYPDNLTEDPLIDYQLGGIGLSDPSRGSEYQVWTLAVTGTGVETAISVSAPNTPSTQILASPSISWARLAFDQNMHPIISLVDYQGSKLYWWDPLIPGNTYLSLPATANNPCVTLDDKRILETTLGTTDVVLTYVNGSNLVYRLQRDRYGVEYVWYSGINTLIANPFVNKVGLDVEGRLRVDVRGALYL